MGPRGHALILLLACGHAESLTDSQAAGMAKEAVSRRCGEGGFIGDFNEDADRRALETTLGGENFVLEILTEASDRSDAEHRATEYVQEEGGTLIRRRIVGFAMFGVMLILFPCFALTACPCCSKCRACRPKDDPRSTNVILKLLGVVAVAAVGFGIFICWGYAWGAYAKMSDGVDNLGCTSAKLVWTTLEGDNDTGFIGMNDMVEDFQKMGDVLEDSSEFMLELNRLIDDTKSIDASVQLATQTLHLLSDMLNQAENSNPGGFHTCDFCTALGEDLTPAVGALDASLGSVLAQARAAAKQQLNGANRADMKRLLSESVRPTVDMKDQISGAFEPLVDADNWDRVHLAVNSAGLGVVMLLVAEAAVLAGIGLLAASCFLVREGSNVRGYNGAVHRSACCVWTFAWLLCLACFMWGGLLEVLAVPLSSACLVLDDVNGAMIRDIRDSLELEVDPASDHFLMMTDAVDKCLNPVDPSVGANLADIFYLRDDNGTKVTMRERLQSQVEGTIMPRFDEVARMISESSQTSLGSAPAVLGIRTVLRNTAPSMSGMIRTDSAAIRGSGEEWAQSLPAFWPGYQASVRCGEYTPGGASVSIPGVEKYAAVEAEATGFPLNFPDPPCSGVGDGSGAGADCSSAADAGRCRADDFLLKKKYEVMTDPVFRCDVFERDSGEACDVKDMRQSDPELNIWSNDCVRADGSLKRKQVDCTLDQFTDYIVSFDERIQNTIARVDATTGNTADKINGEMRSLLVDQIISPFNTIVDGIKCNWLAEYYQETVWGVCYQGVVGLSLIGAVYVALGFLLVILVAIMYALWRRAVDNVKLREARLNM